MTALIFLGAMAFVVGLLWLIVYFAGMKEASEANLRQAQEANEQNRKNFDAAAKIYTRPRPSVDDAIDGL